MSKDELCSRGLVYYDEIAPLEGRFFDEGAMKVGCLGLLCLEKFNGQSDFDPESPQFDSNKVLAVMSKECSLPEQATSRFISWLEGIKASFKASQIVLVSDTSLFDLPWIKYYFDHFASEQQSAIIGHRGCNIMSHWAGLLRRRRTSKESTFVKDDRAVAHCSKDDAIYLAEIARVALYELCLEVK
jgi:hypothetical protein